MPEKLNELDTITISRYCSAKKCCRMARKAIRISDFWVSICDLHEGNCDIDMKKTTLANPHEEPAEDRIRISHAA